ncbi:histone-lysine N-methyltransferase, H3 lysine-9 specific SUVH1 [Beta vulgaris subsp. vulgaris]|uniref:histone-lysine N-methyltransferase, H3 lysine-9 specific SUVH1 n=1 Tax=Beta vulgaris subsp. vulgaris TaxID=3555 RepID=UPI002037086B|nr:histone-lysine N-methyltransferase, H3 lysine-9 specific SUVH1 [Beta vulgaris subsp. vulgaris]
MDGVSGPSTQAQPSSLDKSRVLDVKPLRTLVPMFPNPPQAPPFVCSSPFGPFPSGFTPFYPFSMGPPGSEARHGEGSGAGTGTGAGAYSTPAAAVPLRSFGTPQMGTHFSNGGGGGGDTESSMDINFGEGGGGSTVSGRKKRAATRSQPDAAAKRKERKAANAAASGEARKPNLANVVGLPQPQREDGSREVVNFVIMKFDGVRRRLSQLEDSKEASTGLIKRADLKAGNILMTAGFRTNSKKRIGAVPGVEIGDIFFFRMEMCVLGLHAPSMAGIDYMTVKTDMEDEPLAVSIVSSGGYDDDAEDQDVLVYTGQGGGNYSNSGKQASDQKLERGNLALEKSARRGNQIRVIRGIRDTSNPSLKIYVYDGLYTIQDSWIDKAKSGANLFKYRMVRLAGQSPAFGVWQSILKWKESVSSRPGLILPDLTSGAESLPVSLVNDFDSEKGPPYFTYLRSVKYTKSLNLSEPTYGCNCHSACAAGDLNCSCIRKNGGDFPYTTNGVFVSRKPLVYECGPSCPCFPNCKNRVSQSGLKVRLEVFKTKDKGWGLRSWDAIRSGIFICEFAGEVIDKAKYDRDESSDSSDYVFDTSRAYDKSFKWNYDPPLVGEEVAAGGEWNEDYDIPTPLVISAKDSGNVARFMNHSCSPTVFWQPIVYENNGESLIHIAFFAMRHIPPMTELTYDYGISQSESRRKRCLCGSPKCKGYFG